MQAYVPIAIYRLPGDRKWTANALGLEGAMTDGDSQAQARENLAEALCLYVAMLKPTSLLDAAELDYLRALTRPPEGVEWIGIELPSKAKRASKASRTTSVRANGAKRKGAVPANAQAAHSKRISLASARNLKKTATRSKRPARSRASA